MKKRYGILLHPSTPLTMLEVFDGFLRYWKTVPHFLSYSIEYVQGSLLEINAVPKDTGQKEWKILIPLVYVMAIMDMTEGAQPLGFLSEVKDTAG